MSSIYSIKVRDLCKDIINKNIENVEKKINEMKNKPKPCSHYQVKIGNIIFTYSTYFQNPNCLSTYKVWRINFSIKGIVIISDDNWDNISEIYYRNMKLSYYPDKSYTLKVLVNKTNFIDNNYQHINTDYILYTNKYLEVFHNSLCFHYRFENEKKHTDKDIMYLSFPKSRGKNWKVSTISHNTVENPNTICEHKEKCDNFKYKQYHYVSDIFNDIYNTLVL